MENKIIDPIPPKITCMQYHSLLYDCWLARSDKRKQNEALETAKEHHRNCPLCQERVAAVTELEKALLVINVLADVDNKKRQDKEVIDTIWRIAHCVICHAHPDWLQELEKYYTDFKEMELI